MRLPRRTWVVVLALLGAQALIIFIGGTRPSTPALSNLVQLLLGLLMAVAAFQAARRSRPYAKMFWRLAGAAFCVWSIAQALGTYYGGILNLETSRLWGIDLLFNAWTAPLVMCLFLDPEAEPGGVDWQQIFDFAQIAIVVVLLYVFFSDMAARSTAPGSWRLATVMDGFLTLGCFLRASTLRHNPVGKLFRRIGYFQLVALFADAYLIWVPEPPGGQWFDLVWSVPWIIPLYTAVTWEDEENLEAPPRVARQPRRLLLTQILPLIFPLLVLFMATQVEQAQLVVAACAVLASLVISYARLIVTHREQQRSADALNQQHVLLQAIIEGTTEAVFVKDLQGRYLMINSAGARFLGRSVKEVLGKDDRACFSPETARIIMDGDRRVMESGTTQTYEESGTVDGVTRTYLSTKGPYRDARGTVIGLVGTSLDITERQLAAEALAESEVRFRTIFQGSPIGISVIAMDGQVLAFNTAYRKMLGIRSDEPITTALFDEVTHADSRAMDAARYAELIQGVRDQDRQEKHYLLRDGRTVWADLHLFLLRDRAGAPQFVIGMAVETTERRQLEDQLRQAQRMETIGTLAGGVAHDFNNLLTVIKGYCNLLMNRLEGDDALYSQMGHIDRAADQAASLTRQLLAFSRQQVLQPRVFNLNELVTNIDALLRRLIGENIEMVTSTAQDLAAVKADVGQIEQVVMNLAVNARDAMPNGGKLTLETANVDLDETYAQQHFGAKPGRYVMLAVSDTGVGIDSATLAHIFEPFFTTKEVGKGTGLGLSTVYGIVKQSDGYIWVYSEPGKGATFKVYLPRVDAPAEVVQRESPQTSTGRGKETILLVEDDPQVRELTHDVLCARGYTVLAAEQPSRALTICDEHTGPIHLLLTDVVMPGISGSELALQIVKRKPGIEVLFMSGYTDNAVVNHKILERGIHFLQKPFTPSTLAQKLREILDGAVS